MAISEHETNGRGPSDDWITPPEIIERLGPFDLDLCASATQPWPCAACSYTSNGLTRPWSGRVWLNPPYGRAVGRWLEKLASHRNGIALIFARTETSAWADFVWPEASLILFLYRRLTFYRPDGTKPPGNGGAPSVMVAYGKKCATRLAKAKFYGALVHSFTMTHEH